MGIRRFLGLESRKPHPWFVGIDVNRAIQKELELTELMIEMGRLSAFLLFLDPAGDPTEGDHDDASRLRDHNAFLQETGSLGVAGLLGLEMPPDEVIPE